METVLATSLDQALDALAADPDATVLAGGTDLMVSVAYGGLRPSSVVSIRRIPELKALDGFLAQTPLLGIVTSQLALLRTAQDVVEIGCRDGMNIEQFLKLSLLLPVPLARGFKGDAGFVGKVSERLSKIEVLVFHDK